MQEVERFGDIMYTMPQAYDHTLNKYYYDIDSLILHSIPI
jgi:hypothetical protein